LPVRTNLPELLHRPLAAAGGPDLRGHRALHAQRPGRAAQEIFVSALLSLRGVALRVGGLEILSCVDLDLQAGETLGLIGPNGAGKTTLFNIINGMARPSAGQVLLDGADLRARSPIQRARLGLVRSFQTSRIFPELNLL